MHFSVPDLSSAAFWVALWKIMTDRFALDEHKRLFDLWS